MAEQSVQNNLNYTNLTFQNIREKMDAIIRSDPRFSKLVESAVYKVLLDNWASMTDLTNYYIERTAEESFLESARHLSSVIMGAKQIGYVPRRPIGSNANLRLTLSNPSNAHTFVAGEKLRINAGKDTVTFQGDNFVFFSNYTYTITENDALILNGGGRIEIADAIPSEIEADPEFQSKTEEEKLKYLVPIKIVQGDRKTLTFYPGVLAGRKFQSYKVDDPNFSNFYGSEDNYDPKPTWNVETGCVEMKGNQAMFTRVFVVDDQNEVEYHVNRRSLYVEDWTNEAIAVAKNNEHVPEKLPVCLVTTNRDTTVSIVFGDDSLTKTGPTALQYVKLEYLTTNGSASNKYGVIDSVVELNSSSNFETQGAVIDFPGEIEVRLDSNLIGGSDFEDIESIRVNAPQIFQSLERLVTKKDYVAFAKTITDPVEVRYASAWGEAEECDRTKKDAIYGLVNCALVTALGSPYYKDSEGNWQEVDLDDEDEMARMFIEGASWEDVKAVSYFNIFLKQNAVDYEEYLNNISNDNVVSEDSSRRIKAFIDQFDKHSQITVMNLYVPPSVHEFKLGGQITVAKFCDLEDLKVRIKNKLYQWMNANLDFNKKLYLSDVQAVIQSFPEVKNCTLKFVPVADEIPADERDITLYTYIIPPSNLNYMNAVNNFVQTKWNEYVEGILGKISEFYKVSTADENTQVAHNIPQGFPPYGPVPVDVFVMDGGKQTQFANLADGSGYKWSRNDNALAFDVTRDDASIGSQGYLENAYLALGFSQYEYLNNFLKPLWSAIGAESMKTYGAPFGEYHFNPQNYQHFIKTTCALLERLFCLSMIDSEGNITAFSMDNELAYVKFDGDILAYED